MWCGRNSSRWRKAQSSRHRGCSREKSREEVMRTKLIMALAASLIGTPALAVDWKFYPHQPRALFATSRGAKMLREEIDKSTNGELKTRLHLSGALQIAPNTNPP